MVYPNHNRTLKLVLHKQLALSIRKALMCCVSGIDVDESEDVKKAKILSRTQMILERTKARLAQAKEGTKAQRQRGKRTGNVCFR